MGQVVSSTQQTVRGLRPFLNALSRLVLEMAASHCEMTILSSSQRDKLEARRIPGV